MSTKKAVVPDLQKAASDGNMPLSGLHSAPMRAESQPIPTGRKNSFFINNIPGTSLLLAHASSDAAPVSNSPLRVSTSFGQSPRQSSSPRGARPDLSDEQYARLSDIADSGREAPIPDESILNRRLSARRNSCLPIDINADLEDAMKALEVSEENGACSSTSCGPS